MFAQILSERLELFLHELTRSQDSPVDKITYANQFFASPFKVSTGIHWSGLPTWIGWRKPARRL